MTGAFAHADAPVRSVDKVDLGRYAGKWFEIASFPIFNVGGLGSLEELGITLCNMKLSIIEPVPVILFDTENGGSFWNGAREQVVEMVRQGRAPAWAADSIVITGDPQAVIRIYRERLQLF